MIKVYANGTTLSVENVETTRDHLTRVEIRNDLTGNGVAAWLDLDALDDLTGALLDAAKTMREHVTPDPVRDTVAGELDYMLSPAVQARMSNQAQRR